MVKIVNGQIVEKESPGLIASIIAFFTSIITFITNFFSTMFSDQKPTSTTGGRYTVKTANQNKWKYNPRDFGEGGLNRRIGTLQSHREASQLPGCGVCDEEYADSMTNCSETKLGGVIPTFGMDL